MNVSTGLLIASSLAGVISLLTAPAHSTTYRCQDAAGVTILTDTPVQLRNCTVLHTDTPEPRSLPDDPEPSPAAPEVSLPPTQKSTAATHPPLEEDITIPLTKLGGSLIVTVQLNEERTAQLILDTGASMTVLSTTVAIDLGILGTTDNELLTVNTAGGQVQVNTNRLASLSVGSARATNVAIVIHDLPDTPEHIEGLLGMSFLKHFLVTLDAEHGLLILRPKHSSN